MAKKKVMKIVSVPTLKEVEVTTCDICGKDVGDYRWWISMEIDDGCMGEFYLDIDVCEKHGRRFRKCIIKNIGGKCMEALMCLFGIAIGAGLVAGLWLVAKFAAHNIDGEYDE